MSTPLAIVIVEDNELLRLEMEDFLRNYGWEVHGVDCGEALSEWLEHHHPAVAIVDLNLPYEDGYSIARRLRDSHPDMGIIILTARVRHADRSIGYCAGADVYLTKPTDTTELVAVVDNLMRRVRRHTPVNFVLDRRAQALTSPSGMTCTLTLAESLLIELLSLSPDRSAHKDYLCDQLSVRMRKDFSHEALPVMVSRLRSKCKQALEINSIVMADRGIGYRLTLAVRLT